MRPVRLRERTSLFEVAREKTWNRAVTGQANRPLPCHGWETTENYSGGFARCTSSLHPNQEAVEIHSGFPDSETKHNDRPCSEDLTPVLYPCH